MAVKLIYDSRSLSVLNYIILNILWSAYNAAGLIIAIKVANQKPIFRSTERVNLKEPIIMQCEDINNTKILVKNISDKGLGVEVLGENKFKINQKINVKIDKEVVTGTVVRKDKKLYGIMFDNINKQAMIEVMRIYIDNLEPYYKLKRDQIH